MVKQKAITKIIAYQYRCYTWGDSDVIRSSVVNVALLEVYKVATS